MVDEIIDTVKRPGRTLPITYTYTYDELNRIDTAMASDYDPWSQDFGYDIWGNMGSIGGVNAPGLRSKNNIRPRESMDITADSRYPINTQPVHLEPLAAVYRQQAEKKTMRNDIPSPGSELF